jgi:hypothetical protein
MRHSLGRSTTRAWWRSPRAQHSGWRKAVRTNPRRSTVRDGNGGRFHFNDNVALTLRVGYPAISVGVSFFL